MPESKTPTGLESISASVVSEADPLRFAVVRRIACLVGLCFASLVASALAEAGTFTKKETAIQMSDGALLATSLFIPDGAPPAAGWPAAMLFHGLGGTRESMNEIAEGFLANEGYAVLTFDARAHGASSGLFSADGPRELEDVRTLLDWLGGRSDIDRAHIGAVGFSLGGGAVWRAAVEGLPFAAIVPVITWTDLYEALIPQDLAKSGAVYQFLQAVPPERSAPAVNGIRQASLTSTDLPALRGFAEERSSRRALDRVRAPVFMLQGRRDFAFDIAQAASAFGALRVPKRLYLGDLGHAPAPNPTAERPYFRTQIRLWLDRFLKGIPNGIDTRPPIELAPDPWTGKTFEYPSLPRARTLTLSFTGTSTIGARGKVVRTKPLPRRLLETFGGGSVTTTASSTSGWPHIVAVVSALTPDGREIVVTQGGAKTARLGAKARAVTIRLLSQATLIPAGSRLRLTLAPASTAQNPGNLLYLDIGVPPSARVRLGKATVKLSLLETPVSGARYPS